MPNPFLCNAADNSCLSGTGFNPGVSTWGQDTNANGNCTNYAAYRLANNGATELSGTGDASTWKARVQAQFGASAVNGTASVGSIAWWASTSSNPSGHVGYVEQVNGNTIYTSESIWNLGSRRRVLSLGQSTWPDAFLHIGDASPATRFAVAVQANTGDLYTYTSDGGSRHVTLGMMAGTSPSITTLADGRYAVAVQANTGDLYTYTSDGGSAHIMLGMMGGTSPSIAAYDGGYAVAVQANTGDLYTYISDGGSAHVTLGMMNGTSPSIGPY
jgi:surface antigen